MHHQNKIKLICRQHSNYQMNQSDRVQRNNDHKFSNQLGRKKKYKNVEQIFIKD